MTQPTLYDVILGRAPDGEYEDEYFVYSIKGGQVTMTGKPIKDPFIYEGQVPGQV